MHLAHSLLLLGAALPAVVFAGAGSTISYGGTVANKRSILPLFRREAECPYADGTPRLECDKPGTTAINQAQTCTLPLTNDPDQPGADMVRRNGQGACVNGECGCSLAGIPYAARLQACRELVARLAPELHVVDTCMEGYVIHCSTEGPDDADPPVGLHGTDVSYEPGRFCQNDNYVPPAPGRN